MLCDKCRGESTRLVEEERARCEEAIKDAKHGFDGLWPFDGYTAEDAAREAAHNVRESALKAIRTRASGGE